MSTSQTKPSVIVGFDGTAAARAAVVTAAGEARLRGTRLRVVQVTEGIDVAPPGPGITRGEAEATLAQGVLDLVRPTLLEDRIDVETVYGSALEELLALSVGAELLVVGRGHPGALGVLLGNIAVGATTGAPCPVLVVGAEMPPVALAGGIVVVGVHGAADSELALDEAFKEAHLRGAQLVAIHTWHQPVISGLGDPIALMQDPWDLQTDVTDALRQAVAPFRTRYPLVAVTEQLAEGYPARALVAAAAQAAVLVVGTRGRGPVTGLLLGSVGQHVLAHAHCPVLVARPRATPTPAVTSRPTTSHIDEVLRRVLPVPAG